MKRLLLVAVLLCGGPALAEEAAGGKTDPQVDPFSGGSAETGAGKAAVCAACHGPGGNSTNPEWPKLAGQHATYLQSSLKVLKSGERKSPVMNAQAVNLSDQDMKDLAAFFAAQKPQPGVASPEAAKTAERIYRAGDAQRGLPACAACHGPEGSGNAGAGYPRIGGQHAKYASNVLRQYRGRAGIAAHANAAVMADVAAKLKDDEIEALASYLNGLH